MRNILIMLSCLALLGACSASGTAEAIADKIPTPTGGAGNPDPGTTKSEMTELKAQEVGDDVPDLIDDADYYGKHTLVVGDAQAFQLKGESVHKVIDLEYDAEEDYQFYLESIAVPASPGCEPGIPATQWLRVDYDGYVFANETPGFLSPYVAYAGSRYIMRVTFEDVEECTSISVSLDYQDAN